MNLKVRMLSQYCKGCGYCVHFCPKKVLALGSNRNAQGAFFPVLIKPEDCILCGTCARMCPDAAIELVEEE